MLREVNASLDPSTHLFGNWSFTQDTVPLWAFTGDFCRFHFVWEHVEASFPKLPLGMVKAAQTLYPGRTGEPWAQSSNSDRTQQCPGPSQGWRGPTPTVLLQGGHSTTPNHFQAHNSKGEVGISPGIGWGYKGFGWDTSHSPPCSSPLPPRQSCQETFGFFCCNLRAAPLQHMSSRQDPHWQCCCSSHSSFELSQPIPAAAACRGHQLLPQHQPGLQPHPWAPAQPHPWHTRSCRLLQHESKDKKTQIPLCAPVSWRELGINGMLALVLVTQVSAKLIWNLFSCIFEALGYTGNSSIVSLHLVSLSPTVCRAWVQGVKRGFFKWSYLDSFSWLIIEGGGLTLSVPPGQKLLVIQVTFSSTTCTYNVMIERKI